MSKSVVTVAGLAAVAILASVPSASAYDPGSPYNEYPTLAWQTSECSEDLPGSLYVTGSIQYSCRITELAHIQSGRAKPNFNVKHKFIAIACGRGNTQELARHNAFARASQVMFKLKTDKEDAFGADRDRNEIYINDNHDDHCIETPNTGLAEGSTGQAAPPIAPPSSQPPQQNPNQTTFIIHNHDRYRVGLEFYSQDYNRAWPGSNQQYNLSNDGNYVLNCRPGEKICFGAWRDSNTVYWGTGMNDKYSCKNCCTTCGHTFETTLNDAGPPQASGGGPSVGDVLNALNGLAGALQGGGGGGSVRGCDPLGNLRCRP